MLLFPPQIPIEKELKNYTFKCLVRCFGFGCCFSFSNPNSKGIEKLDILAVGRIVVLVVAFFYSDST